MKRSDDSYSSVDINTRSRVPEHPTYSHRKVSDILTIATSGMEYMILLTELVLLTSVLSVTWISGHNTILNAVAQ